jgi:CBS-domain-containing membrane protein
LLEQLEDLEAEVARGLVTRFRMKGLLRHFPERVIWACFVFVNGFITIGILSIVAMITQSPFIFPSVGPSAFLSFFHSTSPTASPRNVLCGHAAGIFWGYVALSVTGLAHQPSVLTEGVNAERVLAIALSFAATGASMIYFRVVHPPAGATALIVTLGIITRPFNLFVIEVAVGLIVLQAIVINRLAGVDYPLWAPKHPDKPPAV